MSSRIDSCTYILEGADLLLPDRTLPRATLAVKNGRIEGIFNQRAGGALKELLDRDSRLSTAPVLHLSDAYIAPALVEIHIHGCGIWGFERISGASELEGAAKFLEEKGVGCFVPTILWDEPALSRLGEAILEAKLPRALLPGIYVEGPFINSAKRGGIQPSNICAPDADLARHLLEVSRGLLAICTLAPELEGVEMLYPIFKNTGVLVALGHSGATLGTLKLPEHPYTITHLFNAMTGVDHRAGGLANLALSGSPDFVELNGDGIHVNASCLSLAARLVSRDSLLLISDAVVGAGRPYGEYPYYEHRVVSSGRGVRYADTDVLMGSNRLGIDIVRSFVAQTGVPLWQAVRAMSLIPRRALGQDAEYGSIEPGKVADIFIWDRALEITARPESLLASQKD